MRPEPNLWNQTHNIIIIATTTKEILFGDRD